MVKDKQLYYKFPCGCKFKQRSEVIKDYDGLPPIEVDFYNLPLTCEATWELISSGRTRGVFQLESNLGRGYARKLEPDNIDHLAALSALLRPGCMNCILDGKSMTNHYVDRKQNIEPISYYEERLKPFLDMTFGVMTYQEQMIAFAKELAGYTPQQANKLRKAVGKKDVQGLYKLQESFITGCVANGISKENAEKMFDDIKSSGRYLFNASHAYSYARMCHMSAYLKAHFPLHFFTAYLKGVKDNDELKELISELSLFNISVKPPSTSNCSTRFTIKDGYIQYGLGEIKRVGLKTSENFIEKIAITEKEYGKEIIDFSWYEFLILLSQQTDSTTIYNILSCGFLDSSGVSRTRQLSEYKALCGLTGKPELDFIKDNWNSFSSLEDLISAMLSTKTIKVVKEKEVEEYLIKGARRGKVESILLSLINPATSQEDSTKWICDVETELMGTAISRSKTAHLERLGNLKCLDFCLGRGYNDIRLVCEVIGVDEKIIKTGNNKGKKFANLKLKDTSGEVECTIFSKEWVELRGDVILGNVIMLYGKRHQDGSLKIESVKIL